MVLLTFVVAGRCHGLAILNSNYSFWFYSRLSLPAAFMAQPF